MTSYFQKNERLGMSYMHKGGKIITYIFQNEVKNGHSTTQYARKINKYLNSQEKKQNCGI